MSHPEIIVSVDHEWTQALPLSANKLVCSRCDYRRDMTAANERPCLPHYELKTSGWTDAATGMHWDGRQMVKSPE